MFTPNNHLSSSVVFRASVIIVYDLHDDAELMALMLLCESKSEVVL